MRHFLGGGHLGCGLVVQLLNSFTNPNRGRSGEDFQRRREEMIHHVARKHVWPFEKTVQFLESLDHVGVAYIGVDMKEERERARKRSFDPFPFT